MKNLRVCYVTSFRNMPEYIYVDSIDEAVKAIKFTQKTVKPLIVNLEQFDSTINGWAFWIDEHGRDIHEYINSLS